MKFYEIELHNRMKANKIFQKHVILSSALMAMKYAFFEFY